MRALALPLALGLLVALPVTAQPARFIKVDILSKSGASKHRPNGEGPKTLKVRMPITLAKGVLEMAASSDIKVNGESHPNLKPDALLKLLEAGQVGDLLLELTTDTGDHIRITLE